MKPIIIIAGVPQSYTSIISKFLLDNGGYSEDLMGNPNEVLNYERFESKSLEEYVNKRKLLKKGNLKDYFNSLPEDKVIILKLPFILMFINELEKFTNRKIKLIYAQRNPQNTILSSMKKSKKNNKKFGFIFFFERLNWYYDFMVNCELDTFPLISEKLLLQDNYTAKSLLEFCELNNNEINFKSIDKSKFIKTKPTYIKYRFANFIWKRLSSFFKVFNI